MSKVINLSQPLTAQEIDALRNKCETVRTAFKKLADLKAELNRLEAENTNIPLITQVKAACEAAYITDPADMEIYRTINTETKITNLIKCIPELMHDAPEAATFIKWAQNEIKYDLERQAWYIYERIGTDGGVWRVDNEGLRVRKRLTTFINKQYKNIKDAVDKRDEAKHLLSTHNNQFTALYLRYLETAYSDLDGMLKYACSLLDNRAKVGVLKELQTLVQGCIEWDAEPDYINTYYGLLDLKLLDIRPSAPTDLCTRITGPGFKFNPFGTSEESKAAFTAFINWFASNGESDDLDTADMVNYLQRVFGTALIGVNTEEVFIFTGNGGNGKSTITEAIERLLGDYSGKQDASLITYLPKYGESDTRFTFQYLEGKRYIYIDEARTGARALDVDAFKKVSTNGAIISDVKHSNRQVHYHAAHSVFAFMNGLPQLTAPDEAFSNRLRIIPLLNSNRRTGTEDLHFAEKLSSGDIGAEFSTWLIMGACTILAGNGKAGRGPKRVTEATDNYLTGGNDWYTDFCEHHFYKDEHGEARRSDVSDLFSIYKRGAGSLYTDITLPMLHERLALEYGKPIKNKDGIFVYRGLCVKTALNGFLTRYKTTRI